MASRVPNISEPQTLTSLVGQPELYESLRSIVSMLKALAAYLRELPPIPTSVALHHLTHEDGGSDEISVAGLSGILADPQTPLPHASSHEDGGGDELDLTGMSGLLATPQTPAAHKTSHQDGGSDELDLTGMSGLLATAQTPAAHKTSHQDGGSDELDLTGMSGLLATAQTPAAHKTSHQSGGSDAIQLDNLAAPDDNTDLNASSSAHGLFPKLPGGTTNFWREDGTWQPVGSTDAILGQSGVGGARISGLQGSPDIDVAGGSDDEFNTTDTSDPMTGWTTLGSPTTHNINSAAKSHYYVKQSATASLSWVGIYKAKSPSFTVVCKLSDSIFRANNAAAGLFVGESTPGKMLVLERGHFTTSNAGGIAFELFTNPTTYSTTYQNLTRYATGPIYLKLVVTSSTNISAYWSHGGLSWHVVETGRNPGFTVGSVGLCAKAENATYDQEAFFDWIRFS